MTTFADLTSQLRVPVLASPMFIISTPDLVIAQCTSGIIGSFPALNARPQSALRDWLKLITVAREEHDREHPENPSAPFAVNLIVHRSNNRLEEDLATIAEFEVPIVITSLALAPTSTTQSTHTAESFSMTSSTIALHARRSRRAPTD